MLEIKYYLIFGKEIRKKDKITCESIENAVELLLNGQETIEITGRPVTNGVVILNLSDMMTHKFEILPYCPTCN